MALDHVINPSLIGPQLLDRNEGARAQHIQEPGRFLDRLLIVDGEAQHGRRPVDGGIQLEQVVQTDRVQPGRSHGGPDTVHQTLFGHHHRLRLKAESEGPSQARGAHRSVGLSHHQLESRIRAPGRDDDAVTRADASAKLLGGHECGHPAVPPMCGIVEDLDDSVAEVDGDETIHALRDAADQSVSRCAHRGLLHCLPADHEARQP